METSSLVFIGLKSHVIAFNKASGEELWRTQLKGGLGSGDHFVTLLVDGPVVFAHTRGELFALDALSGRILWNNQLSGLGYGISSIAVDGASASPTSVRKSQLNSAHQSSHGGSSSAIGAS